MTSAENSLSVFIVDDEHEACTNLINILREYVDMDISVAGVYHNTAELAAGLKGMTPDVVFLDIEMPKENAFRFLERISPVSFEVIFVTAYDEYAVKAFRLNAVDYILKPISIVELRAAVTRLKTRMEYKRLAGETEMTNRYATDEMMGKVKATKMTLRDGSNVDVVDFKDILYLEAQGSYSRVVYTAGDVAREVTMSTSIAEYEASLPSDIFYRIHKSYLINRQHVKKILKGDSCFVLIGEESLPVSRRRYAPLLDFLKKI